MASTDHRLKALEHLEAAQAAIHAIDDYRCLPDSVDKAHKINRAHETIRQGLKLAEIHALLAISAVPA